MKDTFLLISILFFGLNSTFSQNEITPDWVKHRGLSSDIQAEGWGLDLDAEGNIYWPYNSDSLGQELDVICEKFDENGNELWSDLLIFGGAWAQQSYVCTVNENALYIGGRTCTGFVNTCDMMLLKADKNTGKFLWNRSLNFSADGYEEVDGLEIIGDEIYCGGWAQELESELYHSDIGLWKLDTSGNTIWTNAHGENGTAEHQDGHFVVDENYIYGAGLWGGNSVANLYNGHAFLGKFSKTDGSLVDSVLFGAQSNNFLDIENALGMTTDGDFLYITGYAKPAGANDWQIFIAKFDKNLNQIWYRDWGAEGTESARGIFVKNNKIYVAGLTESESISNGGQDGLLLQYSTDGEFISYQTWGDAQDNTFHDIVVTDDAVYLSGTSQNGLQTKSAFLIKTKSDSSPAENIVKERPTFSVYPNPSDGKIFFKVINQKTPTVDLQIRDLHGKVVFEKKISQDIIPNIESMNLPSGIYFSIVKFTDYVYTEKIVIN